MFVDMSKTMKEVITFSSAIATCLHMEAVLSSGQSKEDARLMFPAKICCGLDV